MSEYHPRRKDKEITDEEELKGLLREGNFATLAFARGDEPYLVAMNYGYDEEGGALYFHCAKQGHKLDFLRANPAVCAQVLEDRGYLHEECDHAYSSLILRGKLREVVDLPGKKHGLEVLLHHLESNPDPIRARNIKNDASYDTVIILRLDIESMSGKKAH